MSHNALAPSLFAKTSLSDKNYSESIIRTVELKTGVRGIILLSYTLSSQATVKLSDKTPKSDCCFGSEREENPSRWEEEGNDFLRVYQEIDDMRRNLRQVKEVPGNKCLKLYWSSIHCCLSSCHREQLCSLIDHEALKVSLKVSWVNSLDALDTEWKVRPDI